MIFIPLAWISFFSGAKGLRKKADVCFSYTFASERASVRGRMHCTLVIDFWGCETYRIHYSFSFWGDEDEDEDDAIYEGSTPRFILYIL